jgi:hypothetical protein
MGDKLSKAWQEFKESFEEAIKTESVKVTPKTVPFGIDPRSPVFHEQFQRTPLQVAVDDLKPGCEGKKSMTTSTPVTIKTKSNRPLDQMRNVFKRRENEIQSFD